MRAIVLLALGLTVVAAVPHKLQKIAGGSETTIDQYPSIAALLYTANYVLYEQRCGGIIINARSVLTAAHCPAGDGVNRWRIRVGSNYANSGGIVHSVQNIVIHYSYNTWTADNDIAMMRTTSVITYSNNVQAARIAGGSYNVGDNEIVWAAGWGHTSGTYSEQLRHVQIRTINQDICKDQYASISGAVTDNMLCAGYLEVGRGQCQGDYGGPLYHNGVVVGVSSWGEECGHAQYPGVNVRISRYTAWIQANA